MAMSDRSHSRLVAKSEPLMQPGERIVHTLHAKVGRPPAKKNAASIAASVAVSA